MRPARLPPLESHDAPDTLDTLLPETVDDGLPIRCRALWRAVIMQAIQDVKNRSAKGGNHAEYIRRTAAAWLLENRRDFRMVCDLAGFDPDWLRAHLKQLHAQGFPKTHGVSRKPHPPHQGDLHHDPVPPHRIRTHG